MNPEDVLGQMYDNIPVENASDTFYIREKPGGETVYEDELPHAPVKAVEAKVKRAHPDAGNNWVVKAARQVDTSNPDNPAGDWMEMTEGLVNDDAQALLERITNGYGSLSPVEHAKMLASENPTQAAEALVAFAEAWAEGSTCNECGTDWDRPQDAGVCEALDQQTDSDGETVEVTTGHQFERSDLRDIDWDTVESEMQEGRVKAVLTGDGFDREALEDAGYGVTIQELVVDGHTRLRLTRGEN